MHRNLKLKVNNKQSKIKTAGASKSKKPAYKPVKKIQIMLNESQDMVISKTMRLFHKDISETVKNKKKNNSKGIQKMKKIKTIKTLIISAILIIPVLFGWKIIEAGQKNNEATGYTFEKSGEQFSGDSEHFFESANDSKKWHIINRYSSNSDTLDCNNSVYEFNKDSVLVINDFIAAGSDNANFVQEEFYRQ